MGGGGEGKGERGRLEGKGGGGDHVDEDTLNHKPIIIFLFVVYEHVHFSMSGEY